MERRWHGRGWGLGWIFRLLLAYGLLSQGLVGAIAATDHALASAASGIICRGAGDGAPHGPGGAPAHDGLCCVLGCAASGPPAVLDAPASADLVLPAPARMSLPRRASHIPGSGPASFSFDARGPPARG